MRIFLFVTTVSTWLLVGGAFACSTCADRGWIESRETCKKCTGRGKIANTKTSQCPKCSGTGKQTYSKREGGRHQGTFCRTCRGTGVKSTTNWLPCGNCDGTGTSVSKVACHTCKGASVLNGLDETTTAGGTVTTTSNIAVETCTQCDEKGNASRKIVCEFCTKGWNHAKTTQGTYVCRNCGAVYDSRFIPCKCGKPDCPHCKGEHEKTVTATCPLCGGDKTITPLEREKAKKKGESK